MDQSQKPNLSGNIIIARETDGLPFPNPLQGIGCFDDPLIHFLVESNVVGVNHYHGISLYSFKADAQVRAERNEEVTQAVFDQKLSALRGLIEAKFGALHSTAKRPRLEPDRMGPK